MHVKATARLCAILAVVGICAGSAVFGNGIPLPAEYYDEFSKGVKAVAAALDGKLELPRETRLRVIKEDLKVTFRRQYGCAMPIADVVAAYTIENPTLDSVEVSFAFPILHGMPAGDGERTRSYVSPFTSWECLIDSRDVLGVVRALCRERMHDAVASSPELSRLARAVLISKGDAHTRAREALREYLISILHWSSQDAALMVEYWTLGYDATGRIVRYSRARSGLGLAIHNLGWLAKLGESRATRFYMRLGERFGQTSLDYGNLFTTWGSDPRERSIDMATDEIRAAETVDETSDEDTKLPAKYAASLQTIRANLPEPRALPPVNLLSYRASLKAESTQTISVTYSQPTRLDTRSPESFQFSYVVHPASLWEHFGPINLEVRLREGVRVLASVPLDGDGAAQAAYKPSVTGIEDRSYRATLNTKTGEIFIGIDAESWRRAHAPYQSKEPRAE